jgi:hypothetical protein
MPNCSRVGENLVIVPSLYHTAELDRRGNIKSGIYLERFISEEVDLFKPFVLDVSERVGLVPAIWENVKRDLATNRESQAIVCKFLLHDLDKSCSHAVYLKKLQLQ